MLLKLLIFIIIIVLVSRTVKRWLGTGQYRNSGPAGAPPETVDDEMIKDPVCGAYFPQRNAVALTHGNQVLYFCSIECRDRYLARRSSGASQ
jgi:hypothetical protein